MDTPASLATFTIVVIVAAFGESFTRTFRTTSDSLQIEGCRHIDSTGSYRVYSYKRLRKRFACFTSLKEECSMEASKKVAGPGTLVRVLALAAMAQGYLSIPMELAEPATGPQQLETQLPLVPAPSTTLGVP
ncbi:hypothetical protein [Arthrobacter sp. SLBN-100]|uniref:hypothetical protein n=1 Tax=Arthrobacter sp. SLBN-100 TaxID=2768450 RepID=UPI00190F7D66|nr:hypothetical protein [Arthrobacter sp. SLBN-100]